MEPQRTDFLATVARKFANAEDRLNATTLCTRVEQIDHARYVLPSAARLTPGSEFVVLSPNCSRFVAGRHDLRGLQPKRRVILRHVDRHRQQHRAAHLPRVSRLRLSLTPPCSASSSTKLHARLQWILGHHPRIVSAERHLDGRDRDRRRRTSGAPEAQVSSRLRGVNWRPHRDSNPCLPR